MILVEEKCFNTQSPFLNRSLPMCKRSVLIFISITILIKKHNNIIPIRYIIIKNIKHNMTCINML